jgi:hypothetical protein
MSERLPGIDSDECDEDMRRFVKMGRRIQEVLQEVENSLMAAGHDDFVVAIARGAFHWSLAPKPAPE